MWFWTSHIMSPLVMHDPYNEQSLVGDLAETWTVSADGTEYTFKLRPAQWHDGKPVTSADIVYNLNRAKNPPESLAATAGLRPYVRGITRVEAVDAATVKVVLDQPSASMLDRLSIRQFFMYPSHLPFPEKQPEFRAHPVGSGPFVFKSYNQDDRIEAVRNPNYFKKDLPYLDGVTNHFGSTEVGIAGTRTGRFMVVLYQGTQLKDTTDILVRDEKWVAIKATAGRSDFHLNGQRSLWQKPQVRQALMMGLDRKFILDGWLQGQGSLIASPSLPPEIGGRWGLPSDALFKRPGFPTPSEQLIGQAKQMIKDAGVDPGAITIQYVGQTGGIAPSEPVMAAALEKLGFKVQLLLLPTVNDRSQQLRQGNFDISHEIASLNVDDPLDNGGMQGVLAASAANYGKWSDTEFDRLAVEQDRVLDEMKRRQLAYQLQERYLDLAFVIPVLYRDYTVANPPYVKNFPKPAFTFSNVYKHEQIWLDK